MLPRTGVIKFTAKWCGPCRRIEQPLREMCRNYEVELVEVDVDEHSDISEAFSVTAMPSIVFVVDGQELSDLRVVGASLESIEANILLFKQQAAPGENSACQISLPLDDSASVKCQVNLPPRRAS